MVSKLNNDWYDYLVNKEPLLAIFKNKVPSLSNVIIHELAIDRDGPTLTLRLDLPEYPKLPPKKWDLSSFNTVQLKLRIFDIRYLEMQGVLKGKEYVLNVTKVDKKVIELIIQDNDFNLVVRGDFFDLNSVSAYKK